MKTIIARKPFQGTLNIIRFNWPFFAFTLIAVASMVVVAINFHGLIRDLAILALILLMLPTLLSLGFSYYIYDYSDLYDLSWLPDLNGKKVLNINAGFDESSTIIAQKFPSCQLTSCDFYDPEKHTEPSIQRARKAYPLSKDSVAVKTTALPFPDDVFDDVLVIFSAHEIRDASERVACFQEIKRVTSIGGAIYVTEHLRDIPNFLAYNIGFFHFHSIASWQRTFSAAGLSIEKEIKKTPFISTFKLTTHENAL